MSVARVKIDLEATETYQCSQLNEEQTSFKIARISVAVKLIARVQLHHFRVFL
jgi:hypothetical protein